MSHRKWSEIRRKRACHAIAGCEVDADGNHSLGDRLFDAAQDPPPCSGARFDNADQASYVAGQLTDEFGRPWQVERCRNHWHVEEEP